MYRLGNRSLSILDTAEHDLQILFEEAIKYTPIDISIIFGYRSPEKQFELYQLGRELIGDNWVITDKNQVVTFKDGYKRMSKHNSNPSKAIDFAAYIGKTSWDSLHLASISGHVMGTAKRLFDEGVMKHQVRHGADWNNNGILVNKDHLEGFVDLPHIEIIE